MKNYGWNSFKTRNITAYGEDHPKEFPKMYLKLNIVLAPNDIDTTQDLNTQIGQPDGLVLLQSGIWSL